jgi:DinB superfamily
MEIVPDTKDWTWVLERPCPECGFDASTVSFDAVPDLVRENALEWEDVLAAPDVDRRPRPDRWSPLEYACHVRDVFRIFDQRLILMLNEDGPRFANWDQDETAVTERYNEQDPATVSRELTVAAEQLANDFGAVRRDQLDRTGTRSDGARFTVESFARYLVHDPIHHIWDVSRT